MEKAISYALAIVSVILMVVAFMYRNKLGRFKKYGYLGIFIISLIGNVAFFSPSAPIISAAGGSIYNPWFVGAVAALGAVIGEMFTYVLGSAAKETNITESKLYELMKSYMEKNGFLTLVVLACVPNPFFDLAGLVAGATGFPLWQFFVASYIGKFLKFTFFAFIGKRFLKNK